MSIRTRHAISEYWRARCALAEEYIKCSPCDPDITPSQIKAHEAWKAKAREPEPILGKGV